MLVSVYSFSSHVRTCLFISRQRVSHNWREVKRRIWGICVDTRIRPRILAFHSSLSLFFVVSSGLIHGPPCLLLPRMRRFLFFSRLLLYYRSSSPLSLATLTRTLGRRVIRRGTCWRKQSSRVNTESDERVIVNWENRVRSLVISIASDCRYLLSRRYSHGQPIYFRYLTFNFVKDVYRASAIRARFMICISDCIMFINY